MDLEKIKETIETRFLDFTDVFSQTSFNLWHTKNTVNILIETPFKNSQVGRYRDIEKTVSYLSFTPDFLQEIADNLRFLEGYLDMSLSLKSFKFTKNKLEISFTLKSQDR
jgi:hypothetical protein